MFGFKSKEQKEAEATSEEILHLVACKFLESREIKNPMTKVKFSDLSTLKEDFIPAAISGLDPFRVRVESRSLMLRITGNTAIFVSMSRSIYEHWRGGGEWEAADNGVLDKFTGSVWLFIDKSQADYRPFPWELKWVTHDEDITWFTRLS